MQKRRGDKRGRELTGGPGRLAAALGVTGAHHGADFCASARRCFVRGEKVDVLADGRIGISRAQEFPWRFSLRGNPFVSVPVKQTSHGR
jgi:DNA-3-methyladenine glycosylase